MIEPRQGSGIAIETPEGKVRVFHLVMASFPHCIVPNIPNLVFQQFGMLQESGQAPE